MEYCYYRKAEEACPQLCFPIVKELRLRLHQCREEISMAVLILAPVLEVFEDGVTLILGVGLKMPVIGYVSPVPNFLGQVSGIENEFRLEKCVFSGFSKESQVQCQIEIR